VGLIRISSGKGLEFGGEWMRIADVGVLLDWGYMVELGWNERRLSRD
jgi:hypothetical protein